MKDVLNVEAKLAEVMDIDPALAQVIPGIEDWLLAGRLTAYLLSVGKAVIKKGVKLIEVANAVEKELLSLNTVSLKTIKLAFPLNISLNECAAHYSPKINDETVFNDQVVKLDLGVNVDGAIGDSAITIDLSGRYQELVNAAQDALNQALLVIKPGICAGEIGRLVEKTITSKGFQPIRNLGGHQIERYNLHSGIFIPNANTDSKDALQRGQIFAIEPFASTGSGLVEQDGEPEIFILTRDKHIKDRHIRMIRNALDYFDGLPFSKLNLYQLSDKFTKEKIESALHYFTRQNMIYGFHPLSDTKKGITSQAEHTIIIGKKPIITTVYN
ncbi:type II methionyl aminopeptidase [Thermoproteota archaeon]